MESSVSPNTNRSDPKWVLKNTQTSTFPYASKCAHVTLGYVQGHKILTNGEEVSIHPKRFQEPDGSMALVPNVSSRIHVEGTLKEKKSKNNAFFCFKQEEEGITKHENAAATVPAGRAELGEAVEGGGVSKGTKAVGAASTSGRGFGFVWRGGLFFNCLFLHLFYSVSSACPAVSVG